MSFARWTPDQEQLLFERWKTMIHTEFAQLVGKSLDACENKARRLYKSDARFRNAINKRQGAYLDLLSDYRSDFMRECHGRPEHHVRMGCQSGLAIRHNDSA